MKLKDAIQQGRHSLRDLDAVYAFADAAYAALGAASVALSEAKVEVAAARHLVGMGAIWPCGETALRMVDNVLRTADEEL